MKILYIGHKIEKIQSGGDVVNSANQKILTELADGQIDYVQIPLQSLKDKFLLGNCKYIKRIIKKTISEKRYDFIFFSESKYGGLCKYIKRYYSDIPIITFFHNIELHYAKEYYRVCGLKALPFYISVLMWESKSVLFSDKIICLNQRDSLLLKKYYSKIADEIIPVSIDESQTYSSKNLENSAQDIDYLFVGSAFFPNISGIQWFIDNVLSSLEGNLYIVGKGMNKSLFSSIPNNVHIIGFAECLDEYYKRANVVISPIFSGGGMKTKIAEALSYGKNIVGTTEAFEGYDTDEKCMIECNTANDFILTLKDKKWPTYNTYARDLFDKRYSLSANRNKYLALIRDIQKITR